MDILIFGGQSNMQGQTESCPDEAPVQGAWEYRLREDELRPLAHPVGEDYDDLLLAAHEGHGSLLPAFCRAYIAACGEEVTAIHVAKGATTVAEWLEDQPRYALALKKIRSGIEAAKRRAPIGKIYYIWLQGESDAIVSTSEEDYLQRLILFKNTLVRDVGIDRFGIIRVGYFVYDERDEVIMQAQERAVREDGDFVMLSREAAELSKDERFVNPFAAGHYNNAGMERLGSESGRILGELRRKSCTSK